MGTTDDQTGPERSDPVRYEEGDGVAVITLNRRDKMNTLTDAYIGYAPSRIVGTSTTMLWVYRLGLEHAKQFLLTGRAIDAETAYRIGLVSAVCDTAGSSPSTERGFVRSSPNVTVPGVTTANNTANGPWAALIAAGDGYNWNP